MRLIDADALKQRLKNASRVWAKDFPNFADLEKAVTGGFLLDIDEEPTVRVTVDRQEGLRLRLDELSLLINAVGQELEAWRERTQRWMDRADQHEGCERGERAERAAERSIEMEMKMSALLGKLLQAKDEGRWSL